MSYIFRRTIRGTLYIAATLVILSAVLVGLARAFTPILKQYRNQITHYASQSLNMTVEVDEITGTWHWLQPVLKLSHITISPLNSQTPVFQANELDVGINLFRSLLHWRFEPGSISINGSSLAFQQQSTGQWQLVGFNYTSPSSSSFSSLFSTILSMERIKVRNVNVLLNPQQYSPIHVNNISLDLFKFGDHHFIDGRWLLNHEHAIVPVDVKARFEGEKLAALKSHIHLTFENIVLADWINNISVKNTKIAGNIGKLDLEGQIQGLHLASLSAIFSDSHLTLVQGNLNKLLPLEFTSANIQVNHPARNKWQFVLKNWQLKIGNVSLPDNQTIINWEYQDKNDFVLSGEINQIIFKNIAPLWQWQDVWPPALTHLNDQLQPAGELQHIKWQVIKKKEQALSYFFQTQLQDVSFHSWNKIPGMTHVNGELKLNQKQGSAILQGQNTTARFPLIFREAGELTSWYTNVTWCKENQGWLLQTDDTRFSTAEGDAKGKLSLFIPDNNDSAVIDLSADVRADELNKQAIYRYLPTGILPSQAVSWLDENLKNVGPSTASLILKGPLQDFPFDDKKGTFIIRAHVNDGQLQLSQGWPTATELTGDLLFSGRSMVVALSSGKINGADILNAKAEIPYMGDNKPVILNVTGEGESNVDQALAFLHQSPLNIYLKQGLSTLKGTGSIRVNLSLTIPLAQAGTLQPTVQGAADLQNVNLDFPVWAITINGLHGLLQFTQEGLSAPNIQGTLFGLPLEIGLIPASATNHNQTQIKLNSILDLSVLQTQYALPINLFATGQTPVHAEIVINSKGEVSFIIQSLLKGIQVNLPLSLQKSAQQTIPFMIKGALTSSSLGQISFTYGKQAAGLVQMVTFPTFSLKAGNIVVGGSKLGPLPPTGLSLIGMIPVCSSAVWQNTLAQLKPLQYQTPTAGKRWPNWLHDVTLNCQQLKISSYTLSNAVLDLSPVAAGMNINIQASTAQGNIILPASQSSQPIQLAFNRLYLIHPVTRAASPSSKEILNPASLSPATFSIQDFQYGKQKIGKIAGNLRPQNNGAVIDMTISQGAALTANLNTQWQATPATTNVTGTLNSQNTSQALKNFGFASNLKSQNASSNFSLNWRGAPYQFNWSSLNGKVNLQINDGLIDGLNKSTNAELGFGRILTILSLQNLPETLRMGFSSAGSSGFNFTKLQLALNIQNGIATIQTGNVASRVAGIDVVGTLNLANQTCQLIMTVTPHVTSSVPVAATLVGGPVVGAAVWVANKVLSPAVNAITAYKYSVTGTLKNPIVKKL